MTIGLHGLDVADIGCMGGGCGDVFMFLFDRSAFSLQCNCERLEFMK